MNTLQGLNLTDVASQTLDHLGNFTPMFEMFARNFSDSTRQHGEKVVTRVPAALSAQDLSSGYTAGDLTSSAVEIELNMLKGFSCALSDYQVSQAKSADFVFNIFTAPAIEATITAFASDLLGLINPTSFSQSISVSSSDIDTDHLADAQKMLSDAKAPRSLRSIMLTPEYASTLSKDSAFYADHYGDRQPILDGELGIMHGLNVVEYQGIPTTNNLRGFACHPSALCIAARHVAEPTTAPHVEVLQAVHSCGIPLQFRKFYNPTQGLTYLTVSILYGVSVGNSTCGVRITT